MEKQREKRVITVTKLRVSDLEAQFDTPVPGTMAERIGMVWPLTAELVSIGGKLDAERRLQRHVAVLVSAKKGHP